MDIDAVDREQNDGSRGTKRPCDSSRLYERLCADHNATVRCVSARTETQPPNDPDAVSVCNHLAFSEGEMVADRRVACFLEILDKMEALVIRAAQT